MRLMNSNATNDGILVYALKLFKITMRIFSIFQLCKNSMNLFHFIVFFLSKLFRFDFVRFYRCISLNRCMQHFLDVDVNAASNSNFETPFEIRIPWIERSTEAFVVEVDLRLKIETREI